MGARTVPIHGQAEEVVREPTDPEKLDVEGTADRRAGEAHEALEHAKDKVETAVHAVQDAFGSVLDKATDALHR